MKKSKLMALAMAVSMIATSIVSAVSVNAEDVVADKGDITKGFDLVYNETKSSEKTRAVDVYVNGFAKVTQMNLVIDVLDFGVVKNTPSTNPMVGCTTDGILVDRSLSPRYMVLPTREMYMFNVWDPTGAASWTGSYLGTLMFEVESADSSFTATIASGAHVEADMTIGIDTIEVPKFTTTPVVPEPPADTRADFEAADADKIGRYDADKTAVPVDAWLAEIDYSAVKLAEGASLAWKVNVSDETIAVANGTTVSGQASVFYGLAIAGSVDQLNTITTVQLIAE